MKKRLYIDASNLFGCAMSEHLSYDENKLAKNVKLEDILNAPHDSNFGYFVEDDMRYPGEIKEKTKNFPFCPENKISPKDKISESMDEIKSIYTFGKKSICDWADKRKCLIQKRIMKFYVKHGMIVDKAHEVISYEQSK